MQKYFLWGWMLMMTLNIEAQFTLTGTVSDEKGKPLSGSHIHSEKQNVVSDPMGGFELKNLPTGKLRLYISHLGYATLDTIVRISEDTFTKIQLKPSVVDLNEVTVSERVERTALSMKQDEVDEKIREQLSSKSLGYSLETVSGVQLLRTGQAIVKPVIHGLHSSRVPVMVNQFKLEDQQWGFEHAPNVDGNAAGSIQVIKGASGLKYSGEAIGGMILINAPELEKDTLTGKTVTTFESNGRGGSTSNQLVKGSTDGWGWHLTTTGKFLGDRHTPDYNLSNTGNREMHLSGGVNRRWKHNRIKIHYQLFHQSTGILRASHVGNVNDLYQAIQTQQPSFVGDFRYGIEAPKQQMTHHFLQSSFQRKINEHTEWELQYAVQWSQRFEFDVRRGQRSDSPSLDLSLITHSLQSDWNYVKENTTLKYGVQSQYQNNFSSPETGVRPLIPSFDKVDAAVYGVLEKSLPRQWFFEAGLRYDATSLQATKFYLKSRWEERGYDADFSQFIVGESGNQWLTQPEFTFHNLSATTGIKKVFDNDLIWYSNFSLAMRNPNPAEFFSDGLHHSIAQIELGDLRLKKETSVKWSQTLSRKRESFGWEITPYAHHIENFMFLKPLGFETTIRGAFPVWEYQQTRALLMGLDMSAHYYWNQNLKHNVSLDVIHGQDLSQQQPLMDMPPLRMRNTLLCTPTALKGWSFEGQSVAVLRQHRFPNFNFEAQIVENGNLVPVEVDISSPPPGYHLISCRATKKFPLTSKITAETSLWIENLTDRAYRNYLNRQRFYADELGRNIQLQFIIHY
jgi:iron complex outermembrane receptor protein